MKFLSTHCNKLQPVGGFDYKGQNPYSALVDQFSESEEPLLVPKIGQIHHSIKLPLKFITPRKWKRRMVFKTKDLSWPTPKGKSQESILINRDFRKFAKLNQFSRLYKKSKSYRSRRCKSLILKASYFLMYFKFLISNREYRGLIRLIRLWSRSRKYEWLVLRYIYRIAYKTNGLIYKLGSLIANSRFDNQVFTGFANRTRTLFEGHPVKITVRPASDRLSL